MTQRPCRCGCGQLTDHRFAPGHAVRGIRLPFTPFEDTTVPDVVLADRLGVHWQQVNRWRQIGVTVDQADRLAVRLGHHPSDLWPEWWWDIELCSPPEAAAVQ